MTAVTVIMLCIAVMVALVGLCIIVCFFQKHFESKEYDERQKVVRGRANGLAMWLGYIYFLILFACVKSGLCNAFASVLPLVFVRPIITIAEFFRKSGESKA